MLAIIGVIASSQPSSGGGTHPYSITLNTTTYYHDNSPIQQGDYIYISSTGPETLDGSSGSDDVDGDGNIDTWSTGTGGNITWSMNIIYTYYYNIGGTAYYSEFPLTPGRLLYTGQGSGASAAPDSSGEDDIDFDGKIDSWNISYGTIYYSPKEVYPYSYYIPEWNMTVYSQSSPFQNGMYIYDGPYSNASVVSDRAGDAYLDTDNNLDSYTVSQGYLTWSTKVVHPNYVDLTNGGISTSYVDVPVNQIVSGATYVYDGQYSSASLITYGSGYSDINQDSIFENWYIDNNGTLYW